MSRLSVAEISARLKDRAEEFCRHFFPKGFRDNDGEWRLGDAYGLEGKSLGVCLRPGDPYHGRFKDFAEGEYGDLIDLLQIGRQLTKGEAVRQAKEFLGLQEDTPRRRHAPVPSRPRPEEASKDSQNQRYAYQIWRHAQPAAGTTIETYLRGRGITIPIPESLRFDPNLSHKKAGTKHPAMVASVSDVDGRLVAVHRTYLSPDGLGKAFPKGSPYDAKMVLGPVKGGAIRLGPPKPILAIAEGIETALSVAQVAPELTVWSALSAAYMRSVEVPPEVDHIVIFADRDLPDKHGKRPGQDAAWALAGRLLDEGRRITFAWPTEDGKDFNDMLVSGTLRPGSPLPEGPIYEEADASDITAVEPLDEHSTAADAAADFQQALFLSPQGLTLRRYRKAWWLWDGERYQELDDEELETKAFAFLVSKGAHKKAKSSFVGDMLKNLRIDTGVPKALSCPVWLTREPEHTARHVALANGILDIEGLLSGDTEALQPHSPQFFSPIILPYPFDPAADCPTWLAVLDRIMPDLQGQQLLQEFYGYCLMSGLSHHYGLILTGEGSNGKSTILKILVKLLGRENCSAVPLEKFEERFALFPMLGKLANVVNEMGEVEKTAEGILKNLISGEPMEYERKYKDPIMADPTAKLIFACNNPPRFLDRTQGVWRRLLILPFDQVIEDASKDLAIDKKLEAELAGIFLWALAGLFALRARGHFIEPEISKDAKEELKLISNPARAFLLDHCHADPAGFVPRDTLYEKYQEYCKKNGHRTLNSSHFGAEVRRTFSKVKDLRKRVEGRCPRFHQGIALMADV